MGKQMSGAASHISARRIALSAAIALAGLVLTAFLHAHPEAGIERGAPIRFDAPAGPWCARVDGVAGRSCLFSTFEQCLTAVGLAYGTCKPNPAALVVEDGPYWTYRSVYL
jgi:hypothetical protein